ncbi:MAG: hypothetical protein DME26_23145 [Verrucomicrobia bacterium]|nr:MAG: hypothetical protein DME26_23145 [Verrucomicrobiota bacterium]
MLMTSWADRFAKGVRTQSSSANRAERGVHAASASKLNGVFALCAVPMDIRAVKRRERRAPTCPQLRRSG